MIINNKKIKKIKKNKDKSRDKDNNNKVIFKNLPVYSPYRGQSAAVPKNIYQKT